MFASRARRKHAFWCETGPAVPWLALLGAPARRAGGGGWGCGRRQPGVTGGAQIKGAACLRRAPTASI
jgi:hypothetical protein